MKDDEQQLKNLVTARGDYCAEPYVRDLGVQLGIHPKRVAYLCEKWASQGWYEYGVSADLGWCRPQAVALKK